VLCTARKRRNGNRPDCLLYETVSQIGNGIEIMLLNSPGSSTLQWGAEQGLLCPIPLVYF